MISRRIAIIGGSGKMGQWFARYLRNNGHQVIITGRDQTRLFKAGRELSIPTATNIEAVKNADVIIISVPPDTFEDTVKEIHEYVRPGQIVFDITSVKEKPVRVMHQYLSQATVLGTHPMFGPGAQDVSHHNFVLTPTNDSETALANYVKTLLEAEGANVTLMSPQEHDKLIAVVLGLTHFIALVSADTLLDYDKLEVTKTISSSTYKVLLTLIAGALSDTPALSASLEMDVDTNAVAEVFREKAAAWGELLANKDRTAFIRRLGEVKDGLHDQGFDFAKVYENMYRIVEGF